MRDALESIITKYRQQFTIRQLENDIMSHYGSIEQYEKAGRYPAFYRAVRELQKDGEIHPIRSSKEHNGMNPTLEMKWRKKSKEKIQRWTDSMFIEAARTGLDLSVHKRHPVLQTDKEWEWIIKVMNFLQQPCPNDVSKEERSYELFGYEKLLDDGEEGEKFIKRVGLNLNDLRAISYGEPFVFWRNPASSLQKDALIVENLSAFHTAKRAISTYGSLYGMKIDLLIYGEGTHIERSLPYVEEITIPTTIYYAGDLDPHGISIYLRLREKYPQYQMMPAETLYRAMVRNHIQTTDAHGEFRKEYLERFLSELSTDWANEQKIRGLWEEKRRIPQEAVSYATIVKEQEI
ncbi:DUF2220 family protein [Paenibacillus chibensis]|uniref:DUF2220 family protein n=1 Tax=Paenibacillus chibensis TaxID=59846 RepID=A0ABU6PSY0_9BACL|nr:DUF2220 family protein [Paenibacillus chibensis]